MIDPIQLSERSPAARVAIIEIVAPNGVKSTAIEVAINGASLTIGQEQTVHDQDLITLTEQLINYVRRNYDGK